MEWRSFDTIQDAIYFLALHGLKPKKDVVVDDLDRVKMTSKNKLAYLDRNKEDYINFEDLKKQFYQKFPNKEYVHS